MIGRIAAALLAFSLALPAGAANPPVVEFDIQVPAGLVQVVDQTHPERGAKAVGYNTPEREDGTEAKLVITTLRLPPEARAEGPQGIIERLVQGQVVEVRKRFEIVPYKRKDVTVNGIPMARLSWDGKRPDVGPALVINYLGSIGNAAVIMHADSSGPGRKQALATVEKVMQSFIFREMKPTPPPSKPR